MAFEDYKHVVEIMTHVFSPCEECDGGPRATSDPSVADRVNHYVQEHGYRLVHLGEDTHTGYNGERRAHTVAIVGTTDAAAPARIEARQNVLHEAMKNIRFQVEGDKE